MKYYWNRKVEYVTTGDIMERVFTPPYVARDNFGGRIYNRDYLILHNPAWYMGVAYEDWASDSVAYYPIPLHLAVCFLQWSKRRMLNIFYWVGLIDISEGERFIWDSFFRIKNRR